MLKTTSLVAVVFSLTAGASPLLVDCTGCAASGGVGFANPALPNNPNANGTTNPPNSTPAGTIAVNSIDTPPTAPGSWKLRKNGNGTEFESGPGKCKANESTDEDAPPCVQETSCTWKLKDTAAPGPATLTLTVVAQNPGSSGGANPSVSGNWTQSPTANPPEWNVTFKSDDPPMSPGCGGEIEFVVTWVLSGGPQRWEISFRCDPCVVKPVDPDGDGDGGGGGGGNDGDGTGG